MDWFWIALIAPALWSINNYIDKYLLTRYFKGGNTGTLIIFSALIGFFVLPIAWLMEPTVLSISGRNALLILISGVLFSFYLFPYFYALSKDEASIVIPIFQTIPIFSFILAYFFLGEVLNLKQIAAGLIIIICFAVSPACYCADDKRFSAVFCVNLWYRADKDISALDQRKYYQASNISKNHIHNSDITRDFSALSLKPQPAPI